MTSTRSRRSSKSLIGDKVHTPALVPLLGCRADLPLHAGNASTGRFLTHYEAFFAVEPIDPFVVDLPPLAPQEDVEPAIAIGTPSLRQVLSGACGAPAEDRLCSLGDALTVAIGTPEGPAVRSSDRQLASPGPVSRRRAGLRAFLRGHPGASACRASDQQPGASSDGSHPRAP